MMQCELCKRYAKTTHIVCDGNTFLVCESCFDYLQGDCPNECNCAEEIEKRNDAKRDNDAISQSLEIF